jgi:hypothetical protein
MPVEKDPQIMVEPDPPSEGYSSTGGYRSDKLLKGSFPNSPIMWSNDADVILTDEKLTDEYRALMDGTILDGFQFPTTVYMDYDKNDPPYMPDVVAGTDGSGNPALAKNLGGLPWPIPNPESSAGPANTSGGYNIGANYTDQNEYDGPTIAQSSINYGSGPASPLDPSKTSKQTADQDFTDLSLGKSSPTRIGAYSETSE